MHDWNTKPLKDRYRERDAQEYMKLYEAGNAPDIDEYHQSPQHVWFLGGRGL